MSGLCAQDTEIGSYRDAFGYVSIEMRLAGERAGYCTLLDRADTTEWSYVSAHRRRAGHGTLLASAAFAWFVASEKKHLSWIATEETEAFHLELVREFRPVFDSMRLLLAQDGRNSSLAGCHPECHIGI